MKAGSTSVLMSFRRLLNTPFVAQESLMTFFMLAYSFRLSISFSSTVDAEAVAISDIASSRAVMYVRASERPTSLSPIDICFPFLSVNCQIMHFNKANIANYTVTVISVKYVC